MPAKLTYHHHPKWRSKSDSDKSKRYGRQWRKVRAQVLRDRPLCCDCEAADSAPIPGQLTIDGREVFATRNGIELAPTIKEPR